MPIAALLASFLVASCSSTAGGEPVPVRSLLAAEPAVVAPDAKELLDEDTRCRTTLDESQVDPNQVEANPTTFVLNAVRVARADIERCGERSLLDVYCRTIWLLGVLDPVVLGLDETVSKEERIEAGEVLQWALTAAVDHPEAPAVSVQQTGQADEFALAQAFAQLRPIAAGLTDGMAQIAVAELPSQTDEERLALLIRARAHPSILEPVLLMQDICLLED